MCMTNEAAAIKLAERDNLVGELVEALVGLINAAENIDGEHVIGREQLDAAVSSAHQAIAKAREGAQS